MTNTPRTDGIQPGRLPAEILKENFADLHAPFADHEATVAADRCYFFYDAPCVTACPTSIDIPLFIRQIQAGQPDGAAKTIFDQNILGGMCARVCPTETLCEEVCVRETAEGKPVEIGRLQRFATDSVMASGVHPYVRAEATGKRVAVVGAGPAGLACAHRLAMLGTDVVVFDARPKAGGLNEYGIASYKTVNDFAQAEIAWLMKIGGIEMVYGQQLGGDDLTLDTLLDEYDAVFLGIGLAGVNALRTEGEDKDNVLDAVDFIADLRQAGNLSSLSVGRNVVVIGGGMTAVDAAVQSKLLGADTVSIVYRRGRDRMSASRFEQDLAASKGVNLILNAQPVAVHGNGAAQEIEFAYT
ncbi:MAG: NAD(P)-dependent oxidoreductase, partial [Boseongicola sp.]